MEVPDGGDETCVLRVFLFLTQITEEYLEVVMTVEQGRRGQYSLCVSDGILTTLEDIYPMLLDGDKVEVCTWNNYIYTTNQKPGHTLFNV